VNDVYTEIPYQSQMMEIERKKDNNSDWNED